MTTNDQRAGRNVPAGSERASRPSPSVAPEDRLISILLSVDRAISVGDFRGAWDLLRQGSRAAKSCSDPKVRQQMHRILAVQRGRVQAKQGVAKRQQRQRALKATSSQERAESLLPARCVGCGLSGRDGSLTRKSGAPRCSRCHAEWATVKCARCGKTFRRRGTDPGSRKCDLCRDGDRSASVRASPAGLPTLGRRR